MFTINTTVVLAICAAVVALPTIWFVLGLLTTTKKQARTIEYVIVHTPSGVAKVTEDRASLHVIYYR